LARDYACAYEGKHFIYQKEKRYDQRVLREAREFTHSASDPSKSFLRLAVYQQVNESCGSTLAGIEGKYILFHS
jgi:hypothetical protein